MTTGLDGIGGFAVNAPSAGAVPTDMSFGGITGRMGTAFGELATDPLFMTSLSMLTNDGVLSAGAAQNAILMRRDRDARAARKKAEEEARAKQALYNKALGGAQKQMRSWVKGSGVDPAANPTAARLAVHAEAAKSPKPMDKQAVDRIFDDLYAQTADPVTAVPQPGGGMSIQDPNGSLFGDVGPQIAPPPQMAVGPQGGGQPTPIQMPPEMIVGQAPQPQAPPAPQPPPQPQGGMGGLDLNPREQAVVGMGMQLMQGTPEQATVGQKMIQDILTKNRQIAKDIRGFQRDPRTGQRVFPDAGDVGPDGRELPMLKGSGTEAMTFNSWFKGKFGGLPDAEYAAEVQRARDVFPKLLLGKVTTLRNADGSVDTTRIPNLHRAFEQGMRDAGASLPRGRGQGRGAKRLTMPDGVTPLHYRTPPPLGVEATKTVNFGMEAARLLPEAVTSFTSMMTGLGDKVDLKEVLGAKLTNAGGLIMSENARRYERNAGTVAEGVLRSLTGATANETEDVKNDRRYKWMPGETFREGLEKLRNVTQLRLEGIQNTPFSMRGHATRGKPIRQAEARLQETIRDIDRILGGGRRGKAGTAGGDAEAKAARLLREYGD